MTLFSNDEIQRIQDVVNSASENVLITFRQKYGPTKLKEIWTEFLGTIGLSNPCVSWWSGAGSVGLLECDSSKGIGIFGQWVLSDENILLGVFEVANAELVNIRAGYDAQSVTDPAMRAIRIGESGGELE